MISMIVVNYNSGPLLAECIRTALPQVDEILVVDNGSEDSSIEMCMREFTDAKLKALRSDVNLGFAAACNIGFAHSRGDLVLFLNPDCLLADGAVSELFQAFQLDGVGMAGGLLLNPDGSEQGGGRRAMPTPWRSFVRAVGLSRLVGLWPRLFFDFYLNGQPLPARPVEVEAVSGACMLVRREAVEDVGLWDEGYFLHWEDLDWCMRFRQKDWKILFVPEAKVIHARGGCSRTRPLFVEWHKHKGMMRFFGKFFRHRYPRSTWLVIAAGVWLHFGLIAGLHGIRHAFAWGASHG